MDDPMPAGPSEGSGEVPFLAMDIAPSYAPPSSTSGISEPPSSDHFPSDEQTKTSDSNAKEGPVLKLSAQTTGILARIKANGAQAEGATSNFEAAKEQMMRTMATTDNIPAPTPGSLTKRGGKNGRTRKGSEGVNAAGNGIGAGDGASASPTVRGRGRGRPPGRSRGSRARGGGRSGKRKRENDDEDDDDDDSDSSEVYTPAATQTKSGRAVQKPTVFVPPPAPSPVATHKRKRTYRRNPESAVCKVCLRGTSPTNNMIVFCDGCNTPYHRYCHHPPIDQSVIDELDKEWYCRPCEKERNQLASEVDVSTFVAAEGASVEERQKYFLALPSKLLIRLLTRATTIQPSLPVFSPEFKFQGIAGDAITLPASNGHTKIQPLPSTLPANTASTIAIADELTLGAMEDEEEDEDLGPSEHPTNYPRPGHGLMRTLPPEQDDQQWLVDDEDQNGVFSHVYRADAVAVGTNTMSGKATAT